MIFSCRRLMFCLLIAVSGCQTWQKHEAIAISHAHQELFSTCSQGDGALTAVIKNQDDTVLSAYLDWINHGSGRWQWQISDTIGRSLASVSFAPDQGLVLAGKLSRFADRINVDHKGYLLLDGHFVGVRAQEGACLFLQKLPKAWLPLAVKKSAKEGKETYEFDDDGRTMTVAITEQQVCSTVSWSAFLGFKTYHSQWCWWPAARKGYILLSDEYRLEWEELKETL